MRILATAFVACLLFISAACGGGTTKPPAPGPLSGNWQITLNQNYPNPKTVLALSGFLEQTSNDVTGSLELPALYTNNNGQSFCSGPGSLSGTVSGQTVTFTVDAGGTTLSFTGALASGNQSMSGDYQAPEGTCFKNSTTGTWSAVMIPPLTGSFTGTLGSEYMTILQTGQDTISTRSPLASVTVSGSLTQSPSMGASSATVTGTITATNYPCFTTAYATGSVSGQNLFLYLYDIQGAQIGNIGAVPQTGSTGYPALIASTQSGLSVTGVDVPPTLLDPVGDYSGLTLGSGVLPSGSIFGPCPPLIDQSENNMAQPGDNANITLTFQ